MAFSPQVDLLLPSGRESLSQGRDVLERPQITITRGRQAEGSPSDLTRCTFSIRNRNGRYSPRNPLSPLYGLIGRNTQAQVYLGTPHLGDGGGTGTPATSHVAPSVTATTAGLLICAWMSDDPVDYTVPGSMTAGAGETDGTFSTMRTAYQAVSAGATGTRTATASASSGYASVSAVVHGASIVVEEVQVGVSDIIDDVTLTTDAQAGWWLVAVQGWLRGFDVPPPDAPYGDDGGWIPLGEAQVTGQFSGGGGQTVYLMQRIWARRCDYTGEHRVIFAGVANASAPVADNHAALYALSGVDDWNIRATVEVPAWPPQGDVSGNHVWVNIDGAGILRRLQQGTAPLLSPMRRAITGAAATTHVGRSLLPVAYWPLEDATGSTQAASGLASGSPLVATDTIQWSSVTVTGSAPLPDWSAAAGHLVGPATGVAAGEDWGIGYLVNFTGATSWDALRISVEGGLYGELRLILSGSAVEVHAVDGSGVSVILSSAAINDGASHWVEIWATDLGGGTVDHKLRIDGTEVDGASGSGAPGVPLRVRPQRRGADTAAGGHLGVWESPTVAIYAYLIAPAIAGHDGETAGRRIERLCRQQGIPIHIIGDPDDTTPMGVQPVASLMTILRECEDADLGILGEPRERIGLAYWTRTSRYNRPVTLALTYGAHAEIGPPLDSTDDDRYTRNDVTASRSGGSSYRYEVDTGPLSVQEPPDGVGRYDTGVTVNVQSDALLLDQASARAHLGTVDELRFPAIRVNLAGLTAAGKSTLARSAAALDICDRLTVASPPVWLGPDAIDQQAEGLSETLSSRMWEIVPVCVPASPYTVGVVEDEVLGRADTDGMELAADFDAGTDTSMSVTVTAGPAPILTSTHAAMFPVDIQCGGAVLTVTGISGSGPYTFTVDPDPVNGVIKTIPAGTPLSSAHPWRAAL